MPTPFRIISISCFIALALLMTTGCSSFQSSPETGSSQAPPEEETKPTALYLDFEDVIIPKEMSIVKDRTVIVSTPGYKSGILTVRGRVESNSLFNFFANNMVKDNWQVVSTIKSPGTTIMVYSKSNRCAVISIREYQMYTYVEIGVAPTLTNNSLQKSENLTY